MDARQFLQEFSIEITARDLPSLDRTAALLPAGSPVSITFLPGNDVDQLINVAADVRRLGFEPVPHISARRITSEGELGRFLEGLAARAGARRAFVIAGDPTRPLGPFTDALAVIDSGLLEANGFTTLGIAGYPEGHPAIPETQLKLALLEKVAAADRHGLALEIMTQFAFDSDMVLRWVSHVRRAGISAPLRLGIAGPTSVQTLLRFAARCGVGASAKVMAKYGVSITRLLHSATADGLLQDLIAGLDTNDKAQIKLHIYPFGQVEKAVRWAAEFGHAGAISAKRST